MAFDPVTFGAAVKMAPKDPATIKASVDDWLDDHPEATTTVQDGSITKQKLDSSLQDAVDDVGGLKSAVEDLQSGSLSALGAAAGQVPVADGNGSWAWNGGTVSVSGTTPVINAVSGVRYVCGEVATLGITLPASGCIDVVFESGSSPTVLTITPPTGATVKWANGFDPTSLEANATYEINIMNGLGVAASWT